MAEQIQPKGKEKCGLQTQQGLDADAVSSPCRGMNIVKGDAISAADRRDYSGGRP